jgi:hypothetical protein
MKIGFLTEAVKILTFAAAVIITCILVWLGFEAANSAKVISNSAVEQMTELNNEIKDNDIKMYEDSEVEGSIVVNVIKKYLGGYADGETAPIYIYVKTNTSEHTYVNGHDLPEIKNFASVSYIKPTAVFSGDIVENENNIIIGVTFTQTK